jgi:hypothetical protein
MEPKAGTRPQKAIQHPKSESYTLHTSYIFALYSTFYYLTMLARAAPLLALATAVMAFQVYDPYARQI